MRLAVLLVACTALGAQAATGTNVAGARLATAEAFIDAFYSFDLPRLRHVMADAPGSMGDSLYYQQWAEAGHYVVLKRQPCRIAKPNEVVCAVTVKDDLVPALGSTFHVTDNFHFAFRQARIVRSGTARTTRLNSITGWNGSAASVPGFSPARAAESGRVGRPPRTASEPS